MASWTHALPGDLSAVAPLGPLPCLAVGGIVFRPFASSPGRTSPWPSHDLPPHGGTTHSHEVGPLPGWQVAAKGTTRAITLFTPDQVKPDAIGGPASELASEKTFACGIRDHALARLP